jgi:phage regulator Rha-like protein
MKIELVSNNSEYRVSSRQIAENLDIDHKNVMSLISDYDEEFKRLGLIAFQTEAVKSAESRGTKYTKEALLNEDQAIFLLALSRNSERTVELKIALVLAFRATRDAVQMPVKIPTNAEMFVASGEIMLSLERRADAIEDRAAAIEAELALTTINSLEVKQISDSAKALARIIGKKYHLVWGEFNRHYNLASYRDLPRAKFMDALGWLRKWHDDVARENNAGFIKGQEQ